MYTAKIQNVLRQDNDIVKSHYKKVNFDMISHTEWQDLCPTKVGYKSYFDLIITIHFIDISIDQCDWQ